MSIKEKKSPAIFRFQSGNHEFVLDINTNRIFTLSSQESIVIDNWLGGTSESRLEAMFPEETSKLRFEGLFNDKKPEKMSYGIDWEHICHEIMHKRHQTIIELTQECNLRCKYCTFGGGFYGHRTHANKTIDRNILQEAINSGFQYGDQLDEIIFGFYGGEPLLAWEILKEAILRVHEKAKGKKVIFSITTNAVLLDKSKATFLKDNDFHILVSLDGPQHIHDRYRTFANGNGSYAQTIKGLKILLDVYPPEKHSFIGINMVLPSLEWLPSLEQLWENESWIPRTLNAQVNLMALPENFILPSPPLGTTANQSKNEWFAHCNPEYKELPATTIEHNFFEVPLARLHNRIIFDKNQKAVFPNGCCIPATKRAFVQTDGTYRICERFHGAPPIGNVMEGIDIKKVKQLIDEYITYSFSDCKNCWAVSLCRICFQGAYVNGKFDIHYKRNICNANKEQLLEDLKTYGNVAVEFPHKLLKWDKIKID